MVMNHFLKRFNFVLWFFYFFGFALNLDVGELCIQDNGVQGICKIADQCPHAEEQTRRGIPPTLCGFYQLSIPVFCCEEERNKQNPFSSNPFFNNQGFQNFNERPTVFNTRPNTFNNIPEDHVFNERPNLNEKPNFSQRPFNSIPEVNDNVFFNQDHDNQDPIAFPEEQTRRPSTPQSQRKSDQKCQEYTKNVTDTVHAIPLVTNVEPISINVEKCVYNSVELIVGGTQASAGEFPFMVALGYIEQNDVDWKCGGTLISDRYVLSAAHCTFSRDSDGPKIIRLGDLDLTRTDDSSHRDYQVGNIVVHPNYRYPQKYNDIALIQSTQKIVFNEFVRPACLFTKRSINRSKGIATGWGKTDYAADNSEKLMKVALTIYNNSLCQDVYKNNRQLPQGIVSSMLCAGELSGGKDTCQGDSGGPLLITEKKNQCKFYVIGVTSFGKSCGQVQTPAIYTRVSEFVNWIESIVW